MFVSSHVIIIDSFHFALTVLFLSANAFSAGTLENSFLQFHKNTLLIIAPPNPPCTPQTNTTNTLLYVRNPSSSSYPNYTCYAYIWVATISSATLSFFFRHDPRAWMLDEIKVYHGSTQLISNDGFETGNLAGWIRTGSCQSYIGEVRFNSTGAKSGNHYYYGPCADVGDKIVQTFPTVIDDTYVISFWLTNDGCCNATEIANITLF